MPVLPIQSQSTHLKHIRKVAAVVVVSLLRELYLSMRLALRRSLELIGSKRQESKSIDTYLGDQSAHLGYYNPQITLRSQRERSQRDRSTWLISQFSNPSKAATEAAQSPLQKAPVSEASACRYSRPTLPLHINTQPPGPSIHPSLRPRKTS